MSFQERLDKIRSSPKLQNQQQTAVVLSAIEDTLSKQKSDPTPTAYFAALLSLLGQYISTEKGIVNKEVAYSVVYLLDLSTSHVPAPLLRSKFPQILASLAPALTHHDAEAPLLRAGIGCLESLLLAQDSQAWSLPQSPNSPRGAVGGLLMLAMDSRPKVRRRAQEALDNVLRHPPSSPSLDHPAADMCAETSLRSLKTAAEEANSKKKKHRGQKDEQGHEPSLMHALQLVKIIASAENGWPSKKLDTLCSVLLSISRGSNEFLTMASFEVFEVIFAGLAGQMSSAKLPRLLEAIKELQPSQNDSQLLPPWIAVLSRGYEVSAQIEPQETFDKLPELFQNVASFLAASSHNIRISGSECLISLLSTCIPNQVLLEPSIMDDKGLEKIAATLRDLLSVRYQTAWVEVFNVVTAAFDVLRWRAHPLLDDIVHTIGDLRSNDSFAGKKEADAVLTAAIRAMGPHNLLSILSLNLAKPVAGQSGRAWLLPLMRDSVSNTYLSHFRSELVPLSANMFQRVLKHGDREKTMDIKIFETVISQIWTCLPGYCELPLDLIESFDQDFAEMLSNMLYQQPQLRGEICKALQNLVDTNKAIADLYGDEEDLLRQGRVTKQDAKANLKHLSGLAGNLLAVLFNVYSQTLPHNRGHLLQCINAYLSITPETELTETFQRVATMLAGAIDEPKETDEGGKKRQPSSEEVKNKMPPVTHTLMDLVIAMSIYLPRDSFASLFAMASKVVQRQDDPQLQKKAYKLVPRLAESSTGRQALEERSIELQQLFLAAADMATAPAKRDRMASLAQVVPLLPKSDLSFIPSILSEVVIGVKEVNEKARSSAFDLLVLMGQIMSEGGIVVNSKVPHMPADAPSVQASLEEYFTMVSAGLAGSTPHMISASITALTRLLYEFKSQLKQETVMDLVQTMDLFLTSNNREIVRSVLGFVKVCVISLPTELMLPRLETLVPNLIVWSHEHKARFKEKVKHIFERMLRRFGVEIIERCTPEADRKLIVNIRKTRDRKKRKNAAAAEGDEEEISQQRKGKFESEYDEAVYGSDEEEDVEDSDISDDEVLGRAVAKGKTANQKGGKQYIVEDEEEPLDLLDRRALAHVSSTKPMRNRSGEGKRRKADVDLDGKLIFNEHDDEDEIMHFDDQGMVNGQEPGDGTLEGGIDAYVSALKGKDAPRRGEKGKLKFSNKRSSVDDEDEMDIDEREIITARKQAQGNDRVKQKPVRRGLGMEKARPQTNAGGIRKSSKRPFRHGIQAKRGKGMQGQRHDRNRS